MKQLALVFILLLLSSAAHAQLKNDADSVRINDISVDKKSGEIRVKTAFAIDVGILEYFLVGEEGKTYESALKMSSKTKTSELNFALLLVGAKPVPFDEYKAFMKQKDGLTKLAAKYPKALFSIDMIVYGVKLSPMLFMKDREGIHKKLYWVYTGGYINKTGKYMADIDYCSIGIWPDPSAPLNLFNMGSNPYGGDNEGFALTHPNDIEISEDLPVEIIIKKVTDLKIKE